MQTACTDFASQLQDPELKTFAAELSNKRCRDCFSKILRAVIREATVMDDKNIMATILGNLKGEAAT